MWKGWNRIVAICILCLAAALALWQFFSAPKDTSFPAESVALPQPALHQNLLMNQINPHFLYNTLESIRGKALLDGNAQVADMVEALSAFFRYNVSTSSKLVSLAVEMNNVDEYLRIQSFRFSARFQIEKEIDPDIDQRECYLPKLTLQPIVENAIMHGLESLEEPGIIILRVRNCARGVFISVQDNGIGMDEETLNELNRRLNDPSAETSKSHSGIALNNINQRIKLCFGSEYGLMIYSTKNVGTTVELMIPHSVAITPDPIAAEDTP